MKTLLLYFLLTQTTTNCFTGRYGTTCYNNSPNPNATLPVILWPNTEDLDHEPKRTLPKDYKSPFLDNPGVWSPSEDPEIPTIR